MLVSCEKGTNVLFEVNGSGWAGIGEYITLPALSRGGVIADGAGNDTVLLPVIAGGIRGMGENERHVPAGGEIGENVLFVGVMGESNGKGDMRDDVLLARLPDSSRQRIPESGLTAFDNDTPFEKNGERSSALEDLPDRGVVVTQVFTGVTERCWPGVKLRL